MDTGDKKFTIDPNPRRNDFGEYLSEYYGKPPSGKGSLHWVIYKFGKSKVQREFTQLEKKGDNSFNNLMQRLYNG